MAGAPKTIDDYLKSVTPLQRAALQKLRAQITTLVPGCTECISYSMPAFRIHGHVVAGFLGTKKGCSFFPFSGVTLDTLADQLSAYSRTKSALHFDPQRGLPSTLVRRLVAARLAEFAPSSTAGSSRKRTPRGKPSSKSQATKKKAAGKRPMKKNRA